MTKLKCALCGLCEDDDVTGNDEAAVAAALLLLSDLSNDAGDGTCSLTRVANGRSPRGDNCCLRYYLNCYSCYLRVDGRVRTSGVCSGNVTYPPPCTFTLLA